MMRKRSLPDEALSPENISPDVFVGRKIDHYFELKAGGRHRQPVPVDPECAVGRRDGHLLVRRESPHFFNNSFYVCGCHGLQTLS